MGGGRGGGGRTQTTATPSVPPEVQALMRFVVPDIEKTFADAPLSSFTGAHPLEIPGLTPEQAAAVAFAHGRTADPTLNTPELLALRNLATVSAGPIGSSPATQEALNVFRATTGESIKNELARAGLGRSGALSSELGVAESAFLAPLLQTEISNRLATAGPLAQLGETVETRPLQREQTAFDFGEAVRQLAQAQAQAQQSDFLRRQGIAESIGSVVTGLEPQTFGQGGTALQRFTQPATGIPVSFGFGK